MGHGIFTYKGNFPYDDFFDENYDIAFEEQGGLMEGGKRIASALGQWSQISDAFSTDDAACLAELMGLAINAAENNDVYLVDDCFDKAYDILDGTEFDREAKGYIKDALGVWMSYVPY